MSESAGRWRFEGSGKRNAIVLENAFGEQIDLADGRIQRDQREAHLSWVVKNS